MAGQGVARVYPKLFLADARTLGGDKVIPLDVGEVYPGACANCSGMGFLYAFYVASGPYTSVPGTHKSIHYIDGRGWYIGETKGLACPVCSENREREWLESICGLEGTDLTLRLDHFKPMVDKEQARRVAAEILSMTPNPNGFVTFHGMYGVGKSMLLKILVNGFRVTGVPSVYVRMSDLLASVRDTFSDNSKGAAEALIHEYRGIRVLAIDEVDRVNVTQWAAETMFRLIDYRFETRDKHLTVLALNRGPDDLAESMQYLASRITGGIHVFVGGIDFRATIGAQSEIDLMGDDDE